VIRAATLFAEAQQELAVAKAEMVAWSATTTAALASKFTKWPKWRVDATVQAEPKFRFWALEVAKAEEAVVVAEAVHFCTRQRVTLMGDFYDNDR
jgi:hypothetical protein